MHIYLAGSIFYYGDELRNREWAAKIRKALPGVDLYSPIENTDINGVEGKKKFAGSQLIEEGDNTRLDNTDVLVACLDGDIIPSGTSCEIGVMREKIRRGDHKYVIGICTDNRECSRTHSLAKDNGAAADICEQQYSYQNLYTVGCIKKSGILVNNIDDAIEFLKKIAPEYGQEVEKPFYTVDVDSIGIAMANYNISGEEEDDPFSRFACREDFEE